jgi:hypothetical protein
MAYLFRIYASVLLCDNGWIERRDHCRHAHLRNTRISLDIPNIASEPLQGSIMLTSACKAWKACATAEPCARCKT